MPGDKFFYKKRNAKVQYTLRKTKKNAIFDLSSNICKNKNKNKCLSCNTIKFYLKTSMLSDVPVYCIFKNKSFRESDADNFCKMSFVQV